MATINKKKKSNNTLIFILIGVVLVLGALAVMQSQKKPKGERVKVELSEARTIIETVAASGKVFPVTEVKISSDVSGEVVELLVEEGDSVVAGQLLAKVDADAYQSQVERGVAGVNSAKAQLANSKSQIENLKAQKEQIIAQLENAEEIFNRNKKLNEEGVVSQVELEASETNLKSLKANLRSAEAGIRSAEESARASNFAVKSSEATLKELNTSLRRTTIFAPMGGIVSLLNVEAGERVVGNQMMSGTEVLRIANLNAMEVQVEVSENDIPRVGIGQKVDIEIDAYVDRKFEGKVSQIAHSASNMSGVGGMVSLTTDQVTNFVVTIDINRASYKDLITAQKPYPFRPGMSASVEIYSKTVDGVVSIPIQAVTTREKEKKKSKAKKVNQSKEKVSDDDLLEVVFVVMEGDTVAMKEVKTGIQDDTYIQILSGLENGENIVIGPYAAVSRKLEEGDTVNIKEEDEDEEEEDEDD